MGGSLCNHRRPSISIPLLICNLHPITCSSAVHAYFSSGRTLSQFLPFTANSPVAIVPIPAAANSTLVLSRANELSVHSVLFQQSSSRGYKICILNAL